MKQITITVPDNYELKQDDNNNYVIVEKEKKLTYEDIAKELFSKPSCYLGTHGIEEAPYFADCATDANNCTSKRQAEKLLAINKLMNVAKYLNGDWQPNWDNFDDKKWAIKIEDDEIGVTSSGYQYGDIYFISKERAQQAIEILGEEIIKLALCTDY